MTSIRSVSARPFIKIAALSTVSAAAMLASSAFAQTVQTAQAPQVEEIIVTGTRVQRDGYEAPTPLTVMSQEQIEAAAPENLADFVNKLPSVLGSNTPLNSNLSFSNGQAGLNTLNLRNLGVSRTLVLLDGQRSVASTIDGQVDVNDFPQQLVSRVDVVTGGASAAYGSDALSGVVNFILDKKFVGIKGEVAGGVTTYGDDRNWKITMTGGAGFGADDRGHFLISGEASSKDGIFGVPRAWNNNGWLIMTNPAYGTGAGQTTGVPQRLLVSGAGLSQATPGGIITSAGPLKGINFGPGGIPSQFNYGTPEGDPFMVGGDWKGEQVNQYNTLDQFTARQGLFTRLSYDVTDYLNVFAQFQWSQTHGVGWALKQFNVNNIVVKGDNAFIPASVATIIAANKITQFTLGSMNLDQPTITFDNHRTVNRYVVGGNGKFDAFDSGWTWDAYWQKGISRTSENGLNVSAKTNFAAAIDAVRGANGQIVCRSQATNPTCVPWNVMGIGVNTQAAVNYIFGNGAHPQRDQRFVQDVEAASVHGEPFSDWAGPISLALGIEHRREAVSGIADPNSLANNWFAGNYLPTFGSYTVTEGFAETVIPLAKDTVWAKSFDLNAAIRGTSYSTSGYVTTWKVGATWAPIDDIRFRATRSRDIRAPNLNDLYQAGTANTNNVTDPFNNNAVTTYQGLAVGNTALQPEVADTTGLGVVVAPSFFPGFTTSVDYYNIDITGAIGSVGAQQIVNFCFQGQTQYCSAIIRGIGSGGGSVISQIRLQPFNFIARNARGFDIDASYTLHMDEINAGPGTLSARFLATHYIKNYTNDGLNPATNSVGNNAGSGPPHWVYRGTLTYTNDPITVSVTGRGISSGVYNNQNIECTSGCPVSTTTNTTINQNQLPGALYWDTTFTYKFAHMADNNYDAEAFLNISNLANTNPAIVATGPGGFPYAAPPVNPNLYDVLGRTFRAGIRFKLGGAAPEKKVAAAPAPVAAPAPPPPPPPPPALAPRPAPAVPQKFLVFFDFDKSGVTAEAEKIVSQAAEYAKKNGKSVIHTTGHTDRAGSDAYNLALSERRARAVKAELLKMGFTDAQVSIAFKGESENLVPTGDGVREPQNRRVEIVMDP